MSDLKLNLNTGTIIENTVYEYYEDKELYFVKCVAKYKNEDELVVILNKVFMPHPSNPALKVPFGIKYSDEDIAIRYDDFMDTHVNDMGDVAKNYREISLEEMNEISESFKVKYPIFLKFRESFKPQQEYLDNE